MWHFEQGFMWKVEDSELKKIYSEEIKGTVPNQVIMNTFQWIVRNTERYVELLKARGANFEREDEEDASGVPAADKALIRKLSGQPMSG